MSKPNVSPLYVIEEFVYQKVKDRSFHVWHYIVALAFLTIIPTLVLSFLDSNLAVFVMATVSAIAWASSRAIGRNLSRNKATDSVLIYRYFAAVPWLISLASAGIALLAVRLDSLSHLLYIGWFWVSAVVLAMHILGIVIHYYKRKKMVKNIKKDELFQ